MSASSLNARVFFVSNPVDSSGDGKRLIPGTLRSAVIAANQMGGKNTIFIGQIPRPNPRLPNSGEIFHLTTTGANENAARTGDLDVTRGELTIIGVSSNVVIDASGLGDRVFQVFTNATLTLQNVTIIGGKADGTASSVFPNGESGGAIFNAGKLNVQSCKIIGNASGDGYVLNTQPSGIAGNGGDGGGICNMGKMTMMDCVVSNNTTGLGKNGQNLFVVGDEVYIGGAGGNGGNGAGIFNGGKLWLHSTLLAGNKCGHGGRGNAGVGEKGHQGGAGGSGAGIFNKGSLSVVSCTINDNQCGEGGVGGAGVYIFGGNGGMGGAGGGIFNSSILKISFSHIFQNSAGNGGAGGIGRGNRILGGIGGAGGSGGGLYLTNESNSNWIDTIIELNIVGIGGVGGYAATEEVEGKPGEDGYGSDFWED